MKYVYNMHTMYNIYIILTKSNVSIFVLCVSVYIRSISTKMKPQSLRGLHL